MRTAQLSRKTKETDILVSMNLDGTGRSSVGTGVPFFDHMLELFSRHSLIDLDVKAKGDIAVDSHHTVEDTGIVMGQVFLAALGDKKSISRFGSAVVPMDESLSMVSVDISGRPYFAFDANVAKVKTGEFDSEVVREFLQAFAFNAKMNLHVKNFYGDNTHHIFESVFKACALALRQAVRIDERVKGVPSTKEVL